MSENQFSEHFALSDGIYLLNHSVGRMPKVVEQKVTEGFFSAWRNQASEPWGEWLGSIERFNSSLAKLLNSSAQDFCPQSNLSSGLSKILSSNIATGKRKVIVASENDFPSMGFVITQAEKMGYQVRWIAKTESVLNLDVWAQAFSNDVCMALISHVHYNTNTRAPVAEICSLANERDIFTVVDIAQSVGVVPIDLSQWHADAVLGSCVKWLCGGPGAGFLWLGSDRANMLEPKDVGWFSHQDPFEFDLHNFGYADSAKRFWGGTPSVLPYELASYSIDFMQEIGVEKIYAHNRVLTGMLLDAIDNSAIVTPIESTSRGGTVVINPDDRTAIEKNLNKANIRFDSRKLGIRLSPHIYNSKDEIETVIDCLTAR